MMSRPLGMYVATCIAMLVVPVTAQAFPIAASGTEGLTLYVDSTDPVQATYLGNSADYSDNLYLLNGQGQYAGNATIFNNHRATVGNTKTLGSFSVNTVLSFGLHVDNTNLDFVSGAAANNPDGQVHVRVQDNGYQGQTLVSFEDLYNGPFHFNDLSFALSNVSTTPVGNVPVSVPEPTPLALMGMGLIGLGMIRAGTGTRDGSGLTTPRHRGSGTNR